MTKPSLLLLGAGNMGGALLRAWLDEGSIDAARSAVVDPNPSGEIADLCERHGVALNPETDPSVDICILAVKPQVFPDVLPSLALPDADRTVFRCEVDSDFDLSEFMDTARESELLRLG